MDINKEPFSENCDDDILLGNGETVKYRKRKVVIGGEIGLLSVGI